MTPLEALTVLLTAAGLAAAAGFRAFVPLFGLALVQRTGLALPVADGFEWLASDTALWVLGAACVLEVAADKVPLVDNVLDAVGLLARPAAGTTAALAATSEAGAGPMAVAGLLALVLSGGIAGAKAAERGASTTATGGLANPLLSVKDDAAAGGMVAAALALPLLVPVLLVGLVLLYRAGARRVRGVLTRPRRAGRASGRGSAPTPPAPPP